MNSQFCLRSKEGGSEYKPVIKKDELLVCLVYINSKGNSSLVKKPMIFAVTIKVNSLTWSYRQRGCLPCPPYPHPPIMNHDVSRKGWYCSIVAPEIRFVYGRVWTCSRQLNLQTKSDPTTQIAEGDYTSELIASLALKVSQFQQKKIQLKSVHRQKSWAFFMSWISEIWPKYSPLTRWQFR